MNKDNFGLVLRGFCTCTSVIMCVGDVSVHFHVHFECLTTTAGQFHIWMGMEEKEKYMKIYGESDPG